VVLTTVYWLWIIFNKMFKKTFTLSLFLFITSCNLFQKEEEENESQGIEINPGDDIQSIVSVNPEGSTFILKAGIHRYFYTLFALDVESLNLQVKATWFEVEEAMNGHLISRRYLWENTSVSDW